MEKPGCIVRTPTPVDWTPTAVDIVTRIDEYTDIMLAYAESAWAATNSARAYVKSPAAYAESVRTATESTIASTLRAQEQPPGMREHLAECVSSCQICKEKINYDICKTVWTSERVKNLITFIQFILIMVVCLSCGLVYM